MHVLSFDKNGVSEGQRIKAPESADFLYSAFRSSTFVPSKTQLAALRFDFSSGLTEFYEIYWPFDCKEFVKESVSL